MKKNFLAVMLLISGLTNAQTVFPTSGNEYCPNNDYTFTFSVSGDNRDIFPSPVLYLSVSDFSVCYK